MRVNSHVAHSNFHRRNNQLYLLNSWTFFTTSSHPSSCRHGTIPRGETSLCILQTINKRQSFQSFQLGWQTLESVYKLRWNIFKEQIAVEIVNITGHPPKTCNDFHGLCFNLQYSNYYLSSQITLKNIDGKTSCPKWFRNRRELNDKIWYCISSI